MNAPTSMLAIAISQIPPEGKEIDSALDAHGLGLGSDEDFAFTGGRLRGRLERGEDEAVHFRGRFEALLRLQCGRCLEAFGEDVDEDLDLFFLPRHAEAAEEEEDQDVELSDRDLVVSYYSDGRVDLGQMIREQLHLTVPLKPLCRDDCQGLCPSCGIDRNTARCGCRPPEERDERLAPLRKLFDKGSS